MIQELFGLGGESCPKFPSLSSPTCSSTATNLTAPPLTSTSTKSTTTEENHSEKNKNNNSSQNNLRCPRCDSTNTKFCYYNNYNLTQPRHFCKTCRRYWTKGGTLRNVPIGGGCRKNKSSSTNSSGALAKAKATLSTEILVNGLNPGFIRNGLLDPLQPGPSPILWPSSSLPQGQTTSHILSLLRGETHCPNPNPNPNRNPISSVFTALKTEGTPNLGCDMYGNGAASLFGVGGLDIVQNGAGNSSNILELYRKWKSSGNSYNKSYYSGNGNENSGAAIIGNLMGASTSSSSSPLKLNGSETLPLGGAAEPNLGEYGIINSSFSSSWPQFPTVPINGTFP